jgi:hypothetical protein
MGLYEFYFPHQAQSDMLWELARLQEFTARKDGKLDIQLLRDMHGT